MILPNPTPTLAGALASVLGASMKEPPSLHCGCGLSASGPRSTRSILACRDPRVPWHAKVIAAFVVAYALSPIHLILDFVPVFGYVDDLIIVPLGIWLACRLIPSEIMQECRAAALLDAKWNRPRSYVAAAIIVIIWMGAILLALHWFLVITTRSTKG